MTGNTGKFVWIVDDVRSVRESLSAVLSTADLFVRDYGSAAAFLKDFNPDEPGCIILDHDMPGMSGLALLAALRQRGIIHPVIVMTGLGDRMLEQKLLRAGASTLLHKPVDGAELMVLLEKVLESN
jgi:two-component system response regulator FixJ